VRVNVRLRRGCAVAHRLIVIKALPVCPEAGVMVTVRLGSASPPKTMFAFGQRSRQHFPELPLSVRLAAPVIHIAPTVKRDGQPVRGVL